jgi:hypothetical protein
MALPHGRQKVSDGEIVDALQKTHGIVLRAAKLLDKKVKQRGGSGYSRRALNYRIDNNPLLQQWRDEIRGEVGDVAEGNIVDAIYDGDTKLSRWWKERVQGYGQKVEINSKQSHSFETDTMSGQELLQQLKEQYDEEQIAELFEQDFDVPEDLFGREE